MSDSDRLLLELRLRVLEIRQEVIWHTLADVDGVDGMTERLKVGLEHLEADMKKKHPTLEVEERLEQVVGGPWKEAG